MYVKNSYLLKRKRNWSLTILIILLHFYKLSTALTTLFIILKYSTRVKKIGEVWYTLSNKYLVCFCKSI